MEHYLNVFINAPLFLVILNIIFKRFREQISCGHIKSFSHRLVRNLESKFYEIDLK